MKIRTLLIVCCTWVSIGSVIAQETGQPWLEKTAAIGAVKKLPAGRLNKAELGHLIKTGEELFSAKFTKLDGAGRPGATQAIIPTRPRHPGSQLFARTSGPDSNACSSCHNDPVVGGAGDFVTNVFVSEGFVNSDFDTTDPQFSNERGTNHLFGAGLIELLAREMSAELADQRNAALAGAAASGKPNRVELSTKGVLFGYLTAFPGGLVNVDEIEGVDSDLVVRPFSQKGVMTSLRNFTVNALNHHHGMQASERFGARWTGTQDFDADGQRAEILPADVSALVAWQATLQPPVQKRPDHAVWKKMASEGAGIFTEFNCDSCHRKSLPLKSLDFADPGNMDGSGTLNTSQVDKPAIYDLSLLDWAKTLPRNGDGDVLVPLFGDLKRHKMTDKSEERLGNELLSQRFVDRTIFMTAELWGVGSTAPYGHRNDFTTMDEIILAHGGDARSSRDAYANTTAQQRAALIAYLKTMVIKP